MKEYLEPEVNLHVFTTEDIAASLPSISAGTEDKDFNENDIIIPD